MRNITVVDKLWMQKCSLFSRYLTNSCYSTFPREVLHITSDRTITRISHPSQENYQRIKDVQFWVVLLPGLDLRFPVFYILVCMVVQSARPKTDPNTGSKLYSTQVQKRKILLFWWLNIQVLCTKKQLNDISSLLTLKYNLFYIFI